MKVINSFISPSENPLGHHFLTTFQNYVARQLYFHRREVSFLKTLKVTRHENSPFWKRSRPDNDVTGDRKGEDSHLIKTFSQRVWEHCHVSWLYMLAGHLTIWQTYIERLSLRDKYVPFIICLSGFWRKFNFISVGLTTGWVRFPAGARDFSFLRRVQTGCGAHPKKTWIYTSTPPYVFMA
jgi:hypothetical protein